MHGQTVQFSRADLAASAAGYDPALHEAPIVVGHPSQDAPAYGWVQSLEFGADGLHAVPRQVDPEFVSLVEAGRFKKVSASLYPPDHPGNPKPGIYYLKHVGFLGAAAPAVKGLKPAQLGADDAGCLTLEFAAADAWTVSGLFRALRDWLIGEKGQEVADKVLPDSAITALQSAAISEALDQDDGADVVPAFSDWTAARREQLAKGEIKGGFAGPDQSYPIAGPDDVKNAWTLAGRAANPDAVRKKIIEIAKAHGWADALPATAQDWAKQHHVELSEADMTDTTVDLAAQSAQLQKEREALAAREKAIADKERAMRRSEIVAFVDGLVKEAKVRAADRNFLVELACALPADQTLEFSEDNGQAAKVNVVERLKSFLSALPQMVQLGEHPETRASAAGAQVLSFTAPSGRQVDRAGLEIHSKAVAYQRQHQCSYVEAVKAVGGA